MLHPHTELRFISDAIGYGIFATRFIPKGTVVWVQDELDRVYTEAQVRAMGQVCQEVLERYCFRDNRGRWVFCWDNTRFINHSFYPNCITTPYRFELAVADIEPGTEITNDYGFFNIIEPFDCIPEDGSSRTCVMPDDLLQCADEWDRRLADAFTLFEEVDQPLIGLIEPDHLKKARLIARGEAPPDSIRACYFDPACPVG